MRNNDLQEQIPSWSSLFLFSIRSKKTGDDIWVDGWWFRFDCCYMFNDDEQERAQKGKKRTNFAQTISGWTVGCFPKVANPQSEPACAQRVSQIWSIFDKHVSVRPGLFLCPQYWRTPGASYEVIFEILQIIFTFIWLDFTVCFCRWSDSHNKGAFIREYTLAK